MAEDHDDHQTRAELDSFIALMKTLPGYRQIVAEVRSLTQTVATLTARVAALEQECEALRNEALIRFWERETQGNEEAT